MEGTEKKPGDTCLKGPQSRKGKGAAHDWDRNRDAVSSGVEASGEQPLPGASPALCNLPCHLQEPKWNSI